MLSYRSKKTKLLIVLLVLTLFSLFVFKRIEGNPGVFYRAKSIVIESNDGKERVVLYRKIQIITYYTIVYCDNIDEVLYCEDEPHKGAFLRYSGDYYDPISLLSDGVITVEELDDLGYKYYKRAIPIPEEAE